jgi:HSP20 family molecular chaperone IbpA
MAEVKEAPNPKAEAERKPGQATQIERRSPTPVAAAGDGHSLPLMRRFSQKMDQLFEDFGLRLPSFFGRGRELLKREVGLIPAEWSPRVDVRERDGTLKATAEFRKGVLEVAMPAPRRSETQARRLEIHDKK